MASATENRLVSFGMIESETQVKGGANPVIQIVGDGEVSQGIAVRVTEMQGKEASKVDGLIWKTFDITNGKTGTPLKYIIGGLMGSVPNSESDPYPYEGMPSPDSDARNETEDFADSVSYNGATLAKAFSQKTIGSPVLLRRIRIVAVEGNGTSIRQTKRPIKILTLDHVDNMVRTRILKSSATTTRQDANQLVIDMSVELTLAQDTALQFEILPAIDNEDNSFQIELGISAEGGSMIMHNV